MKTRLFAVMLLIILCIALPANAVTTVSGIVIDKRNNKAVAGATIFVFATKKIALTDENGRFTVQLPETGSFQVRITSSGFKRTDITVNDPAKNNSLKIYLAPASYGGEDVLVTDIKDKPLTSRQTVTREELKKIPGTAGDIMRSIQSLPGVATANDVSSQLYVRGNGPYDNRFLFDKFWLTRAYHFGGFVSVINSDLINTIDFYTGGFPVPYGEANGSILDITSREKLEPTWGAKININLLTADAVVETPFTDNGYMIISGRRSYFDLYAQEIVKRTSRVEVTELPKFWDYQAKIGYKLGNESKIEFLAYGAGDGVALSIKSGGDIPAEFENQNANFNTDFHGQGFTWKWTPSKFFLSTFKVGALEQTDNMMFGKYFTLKQKTKGAMAREDITISPAKWDDIDVGVEYIYGLVNASAVVPIKKPGIGQNAVFPRDFLFLPFELKDLDYTHFGSYIQNTMNIAPLKWVVGCRYDIQEDVRQYGYLSPRTSFELSLNKTNRVSFATGLFQTAQNLYFTNKDFGNPSLSTQKAMHYVLGYEIDLTKNVNFRMETYYKDLWDLALPRQPITDNGTGYSYGAEALLRHKLAGNFFGWFSYGYSVSKRNDHDGRGEYFYEFDRTHMVNIIASYRINEKWQIGAKARYSSGLVYTPIIGSDPYNPSENPAVTQYYPRYSDQTYSRRLPDYHKIDIRIDRYVTYDSVKYNFYLEILNVYNSENVSDMRFNRKEPYSSTNPKKEGDLPILPYFGVEIKF